MKRFKSEELQDYVSYSIIDNTLRNISISIRTDFPNILPFILRLGDYDFCYYLKWQRNYDYQILIELINNLPKESEQNGIL